MLTFHLLEHLGGVGILLGVHQVDALVVQLVDRLLHVLGVLVLGGAGRQGAESDQGEGQHGQQGFDPGDGHHRWQFSFLGSAVNRRTRREEYITPARVIKKTKMAV